jgi:hypothetical protein
VVVIIKNDQMKEDEIGEKCRALGGEEKCIQNFGLKA